MITQSHEMFIVEISTGNYWLQDVSRHDRIFSTSEAHRATSVQPGSPHYQLQHLPKHAFPEARVVKVRVVTFEVEAAGARIPAA